jgi:pimeloyl-ACP methyl ester carboxylesterase
MAISSREAAVAAALLLVVCMTAATPLRRPNCHSFYLDVPITAKSWTLNVSRVDNDIDAVNFALNLDRWSGPNATELVVASEDIQATYITYAELCFPAEGKDKKALQILTHGAFFDHRYCRCKLLDWLPDGSADDTILGDATIDQGSYSYVKAATDAGYTVFNYDRLNNGRSDKLDAYTVGNGENEVETLRVLTEMARNGTFGQHIRDGSSLPQVGGFEKVIHVSHSFGSAITAALLSKYGDLSSGAILTGLLFTTHPSVSTSVSQGFGYAATTDPALFGQYPSGYIIPDDTNRIQSGFFHRYNATDPAGFTDKALNYAESIKSPVTVAEWVSLKGALPIGPSSTFRGPLEFFVGEHDALICSGECYDNYDLAMLKEFYPNAAARDVYVQPGSGHGLTLHKNATAGYGAMFDWLVANDL